ncbi:MAG TPA: sugar-binding protein [Chryseolinea sp.]|nr:sugar-binding protein [Chryseolinea sp.]
MKGFYTLVVLFFVSEINGQQGGGADAAQNVVSEPSVNGIRIAWDHKTLKQLSPPNANYSGYARMIKLQDGSLFCVYESDKATHAIKSIDGGRQWSDPIVIAAPENNIACAVPEVLQLLDNSIIVSYNLRPPANNADPQKRFSIQVTRSSDGGKSWNPPVEVYKAGYEFKNGCWEPAQIQLPNGEIQLYIANEGPYTQSNEQEITMFRSTDQGLTWTNGETVSFRSGHRDGMPVPLLLKNDEIILAIEDNGVDGKEFKPVIIRTSAVNSWSNAPVSASDPARDYALDKLATIPDTNYAGAPYIRQLTSGEVILSYQGNELRNDFKWDHSDMIVSIGSPLGKNFNRKSIPFYISDPSKTALWNSLCVENDSTVIALTSTNAYGKTAVWMIKGHVLVEIQSYRATISDGKRNDPRRTTKTPIFIGGYGPTQAHINAAWNDQLLFITADVEDNQVFSSSGDPRKDDAVQFYLDPQNLSLRSPDKNIFRVTVTAGGRAYYNEGKNGTWDFWKPTGVVSKSRETASGYQVEVAIPWAVLNHSPQKNKRIGFHASVMETTTGIRHDYSEPLAGNITNAPYSWSPLFLID